MPVCFLVITVVLYASVNFSLEIIDKYNEKQKLESKLITLKEEEQRLAVDVKKLQNPEYIARYLREKFLYSKEGEYIIKLPQKSGDW